MMATEKNHLQFYKRQFSDVNAVHVSPPGSVKFQVYDHSRNNSKCCKNNPLSTNKISAL